MTDGHIQAPWRTERRQRDRRREHPGLERTGPQFSVVIPIFNEEDAIEHTLDTISATLANGRAHELIAVDDGSTDRTAEVLRAYADAHPDSVRVVSHRSNSGYGAALKTGIRNAASDVIVIADADGTYPMDRIPELVETLFAEEAVMVVGARVGPGVRYSPIRRIPKVFLKAYIDWLARTHVPDFNSGLRVFRRDIAERFFGILPEGFSFTTTITLACLTNRHPVIFVPISYAPRLGKSKIQPVRDTLRFTNLIIRTGMYFAPLRVLLPIAVVLFLLALISFGFDLRERNLTESTLLLFMFSMNVGVFALLADMIDKRMPK